MKRECRFGLVDAFTKVILGGNPCAVILLKDEISEELMLRIAREMNQSETAFVRKDLQGNWRARFFTIEKEIPMAGHPTLALTHFLQEEGLLRNHGKIVLHLIEGPIEVELDPTGRIKMFQRKPEFFEIHDPNLVMPLFGLRPDDRHPTLPIQTVSTGTRQLMVPVKDLEVLRRVQMKASEYLEYRGKMNFFSPHLFCLGGITPEGRTFARHPATPPSTLEDAFTGSSTGNMAALLWKGGALDQPQFLAQQGHWLGRPGEAWVEVSGSRQNIEKVSVAGFAKVVVAGQINLPSEQSPG